MTDLVVQPRRNSDEKFCHSCGRTLHQSAPMCPSCGAAQSADSLVAGAQQHPNPQIQPSAQLQPAVGNKPPAPRISNAEYCRGCGQQVHATAPQCPHCGAIRRTAATGLSEGPKSRVAAGVLALLLGAFGVHKFYCGHVGWGLVYLIFFWTWIPAIVALVEAILYFVCHDDAEFTEKYCASG